VGAGARADAALGRRAICDDDVARCEAIGDHGLALIRAAGRARPGIKPVRVLTHCNAGWLATVDWGTALAPIYKAHEAACRSRSGSTRPGRATRAC
jgi:methylthioribose-1-phosphate isomerase